MKSPWNVADPRIARFEREIIHTNVLEPIAYDGSPFDSVGRNNAHGIFPNTIDSGPLRHPPFGHHERSERRRDQHPNTA